MKNRLTFFIVFLLTTLCLFGIAVPAQVRRRPRAVAIRPRLAPITVEQKAKIVEIIKAAEDLEITYNYRPEEYANDADKLSSQCLDVRKMLPDGPLQNLISEMFSANRDASMMYGVYMPRHKGWAHHMVESSVMKGEMDDPTPEIIRRYSLQRLNPYQAQSQLFNYSSALNSKLGAALDGTPTAQKQPENDWAFPKPGMRSYYSDHTEGKVYNVGDGVFAGHLKLDTNRGNAPIVLVIFPALIPGGEMSDEDLAVIAVFKVVNRLTDVGLKRAESGEYRFQTITGRVVRAAVAHDKRTAFVQFE